MSAWSRESLAVSVSCSASGTSRWAEKCEPLTAHDFRLRQPDPRGLLERGEESVLEGRVVHGGVPAGPSMDDDVVAGVEQLGGDAATEAGCGPGDEDEGHGRAFHCGVVAAYPRTARTHCQGTGQPLDGTVGSLTSKGAVTTPSEALTVHHYQWGW